MRIAVIVSLVTEFIHTTRMSNSQLNLLIVEDDQILATSLKLMAPDGFKVYLAQKLDLVPDHVFFHAALVDMHLNSHTLENPEGPLVIQKISKNKSAGRGRCDVGKFRSPADGKRDRKSVV